MHWTYCKKKTCTLGHINKDLDKNKKVDPNEHKSLLHKAFVKKKPVFSHILYTKLHPSAHLIEITAQQTYLLLVSPYSTFHLTWRSVLLGQREEMCCFSSQLWLSIVHPQTNHLHHSSFKLDMAKFCKKEWNKPL